MALYNPLNLPEKPKTFGDFFLHGRHLRGRCLHTKVHMIAEFDHSLKRLTALKRLRKASFLKYL